MCSGTNKEDKKTIEENTVSVSIPKTINEENEAGDQNVNSNNVDIKWWKRIIGLGLIIIVLKNVLKGAGDIIVKKITGINAVTLLLYRSVVALSFSTPVSLVKDEPPFPPGYSAKDRFLLVFRCVIACLQGLAGFYALQQMPIGVSKMIVSTKPVFTIIFARIFLGEQIDIIDGFNVLLMMGGAMTVIRPWGIENAEGLGYQENHLLAGILLFFGTALGSNVGVILRHFRKQSVASLTTSREIVYVIMTFGTIFAVGLEMGTPGYQERLCILAIGILTLITQAMNIVALKLEEAGKVALVDRCSSMIISFTSQILIFNELPDMLTWTGLGLVTLAILIMGIKKIWKSHQKKKGGGTNIDQLLANMIMKTWTKEKPTVAVESINRNMNGNDSTRTI